jgi:EAL domain-containing protein (putative c-di-GMP-specific phosphodiesterase class I)
VSLSIEALERISATRGRAVGDGEVQEIVSGLTRAVREGDTVARQASGELGIAIVGAEAVTEIEILARKLVEDAPSSITVEGRAIFMSLAAGVAVYPEDGADPDELIQNASVARQASSSGRVTFFSSDLNAEVERRRLIEGELREAIEKQELSLNYQPVVDVGTRGIVGAEALLRWHSEALGHVSPVDFIHVAEETGLILPIGQWVIEAACEQGREWHRLGIQGLRISFNVSVNQLRQVDFVDRVMETLGGVDFDPGLLTLGLEITESLLMENLEEAAVAIRRFRQLGVRTYIDDFGIGYSSLSYLRELPIDLVKIDASFVRDLPGDEDAVAVVSGIIAMAHSLGLQVIAEGVETEGQFATLEELDCDMAQGFLFSPPVPPAEFEAALGRRLAPGGVG